mmetsp:Transcript_26677/g.76967  ORF Transcript_26677/g.76967 Transcript_26677/m.76967 type:complete len:461 (-) Transcript_26677:161-1543(-)
MSSPTRIAKIPAHLAIDVLYADDSVVVINKPCHLRSVPGHANPPPTLGKRKRSSDDSAAAAAGTDIDPSNPKNESSNRQTAQEAWMAAIQSFAEEEAVESAEGGASPSDDESRRVRSFLRKLSTFAKNGIPRKKKLFIKYANRNRQRLFGDGSADTQKLEDAGPGNKPTNNTINAIADLVYERIKERQIPLLNLPEQTKDEESAEGQLKLLGYEDLRKKMPGADERGKTISSREGNEDQEDDEMATEQSQQRKAIPKEFYSRIRVVHRLDMETSGLLAFARTEEAASKLCKAWRKRGSVKKYYLARCLRWPPYHAGQEENGEINLPLAPSDERLKWKVVREDEDGAKPSTTLWSVWHEPQKQVEDGQGRKDDGKDKMSAPVVLELQPVTGRTHQLRIHCAAIGSGIEGDTLYGDHPIEWDGTAESAKHTLRLHAHQLHFPHPTTGEMMEFTSKAAWCVTS